MTTTAEMSNYQVMPVSFWDRYGHIPVKHFFHTVHRKQRTVLHTIQPSYFNARHSQMPFYISLRNYWGILRSMWLQKAKLKLTTLRLSMVLHSNIVERELICITHIIPVKQIWLSVTKDSFILFDMHSSPNVLRNWVPYGNWYAYYRKWAWVSLKL